MKLTLLLLISIGVCLITMVSSAPLHQDSVGNGRQNVDSIQDDDEDEDDDADAVDDIEDALDGGDDDNDEDDDDEGDDDESEDDDDDEDYLERVLDDFVGDDDDDDDDDDEEDNNEADDSDASNIVNSQQLATQAQQDLADPSNIVYDDTEDFAPSQYDPQIDPNNDDAVRVPSNSIETNDVNVNSNDEDDDDNDDEDEDDEDDDDDDFISDEAIEARDSGVKNAKKPKKKTIKNKKHV